MSGKQGVWLFNALKANTQASRQSRQSLSLIWLQRAVSWSRSAAAAKLHAGFRWLSSAVVSGEGWCPAEWVAVLESASCIHSCQAINTIRAHWHFKSSLRARANRPRQWLLLGTFARGKLPFFKLQSGQRAKNIGFAFLEDESNGCVPFLPFDELFSSRDLKVAVPWSSVHRIHLHRHQCHGFTYFSELLRWSHQHQPLSWTSAHVQLPTWHCYLPVQQPPEWNLTSKTKFMIFYHKPVPPNMSQISANCVIKISSLFSLSHTSHPIHWQILSIPCAK